MQWEARPFLCRIGRTPAVAMHPHYRGAGDRVQQAKFIRSSTCKLMCSGRPFDFLKPYNTHTTAFSGTGTGFVIDAFPGDATTVDVVTAYHVVRYATKIMVEFYGVDAGPLPGTLRSYDTALDVALLTVEMPAAQRSRVTLLQTGNSDDALPNDAVLVVGHALGHDYQMTTGSISGRTCTPERLQCDAAVNPGNSGGPLLDADHAVIGVVVSGYDDAQNVNFVAPIVETLTSLRHLQSQGGEAPRAMPCRSLNATVVPSFEAMRAATGCPHGAYVAQVHPRSSLAAAGVERGDTICSIAGYDVTLRGKIHCAWWQVDALLIETLLTRQLEGDTLPIAFWSSREGAMRHEHIAVQRELARYRDVDPMATPPPYSCAGGIVVQALTRNHGEITQRYRHIMAQPQVRERSLMVVTAIRPESPLTTMNTVRVGHIVTYVNDTVVTTLEEYVDAWRVWEASDAPFVALTFYNGTIAAAERGDVVKADAVMLGETGMSDVHADGASSATANSNAA